METKSCELAIKQVSEGKVVATLARLGVRDRDGDVLRKGLVRGHQLVAIKPQHKWDHVNLGVADVYENGDTMEAAMEFNLAIPSAKDWFEAIRFSHDRGHRQQYSFGFEPREQERGTHDDGKEARFLKYIELAECSPVLIGASIGSQTLSVKEKESESMTDDAAEKPAGDPPEEKTVDVEPDEIEDYTKYPEDRRPPLPVLVKWLRLYRYHIPFLRDIRKKDGKEISEETIAEFSEVVQEAVEVASLLNIKVMTSHLMPNIEEEQRQKEWYHSRLQELSAEVNAETQHQLQALQTEAAALAHKARERSARMRELFGS
mgnify:FL=1